MIAKKTYPIPALAEQIELEWVEELAAHYGRAPEEVAAKIRSWFVLPPGTVRIEFMDQSCVEFCHAIFIVSESRRAIAVFTEHCGHHLYPYHESKIYRDGRLAYEQSPA